MRLSARIGSREVTFSPEDLTDDRGRVRLAHAYATTCYGAQGLTVETAFVWTDAALNRHRVFVAASRARGTSRLFIDRQSLDAAVREARPLSDRGRPIEADERQAALARALSRSGEKSSTLDLIDQDAVRSGCGTDTGAKPPQGAGSRPLAREDSKLPQDHQTKTFVPLAASHSLGRSPVTLS